MNALVDCTAQFQKALRFVRLPVKSCDQCAFYRLATTQEQHPHHRITTSAMHRHFYGSVYSSRLDKWPRRNTSDIFSQRSLQYRSCRYTTASTKADDTGCATKTCWNCQRETSQSSVLCDNDQCAAIQPVGKNTTYYDVLVGGRATFDVDTAQLRRNFLRLQQAVHPDSFSQRPDIERKLAEAQSSWINHAYSALKDPLLRAHYLLGLYGRGIDEEDVAADPELLMEIMEIREEIERARTEPQISSLRQANDSRITSVIEELSRAFGSGALESARQLTNKLQYLRRVAQAIQRWEPGKPVVIAH